LHCGNKIKITQIDRAVIAVQAVALHVAAAAVAAAFNNLLLSCTTVDPLPFPPPLTRSYRRRRVRSSRRPSR
jgi:hypothetical protein